MQKWGAIFQAEEKRQTETENTIPVRGQIISGEEMWRERLGASMDGAMIYILEDGWKEFKIGTVFKIEAKSVLDKTTLEEESVGCARDVSEEIAYLLQQKTQIFKSAKEGLQK